MSETLLVASVDHASRGHREDLLFLKGNEGL